MADHADFDRLVRPELAGCLDTAQFILHELPAAEDAVQEALARAWQAWPRFDSTRPLRPWLLRIVTREALRWHRRWRLPWSHELPEYVSAPDVSPAAVELADIFSRLPRRDRAILTLRYLWGYSIAETAEMLDLPEGTVRSRVHRASQRASHAWWGKEA